MNLQTCERTSEWYQEGLGYGMEGLNLNHGEIPVVLHAFCNINECKGDHPIFYGGGIRIERKNLELDRVEAI